MRWTMTLPTVLAVSLAGYLPWAIGAEDPQPASKGAETGSRFSPYVDDEGEISRPKTFRRDWVHLGSWFVREDEQASGPGVHDVYTQPSTVERFLETGQWPDGAVLVKQISGIREETLTTGQAQWAGDTNVWFVMVRDRENRFPDNEAWAEGWGWALFTQDSPETSTTTTWKGEGFNNCFGCHLPAKDTEWVFIEGYPTVRGAANYPD